MELREQPGDAPWLLPPLPVTNDDPDECDAPANDWRPYIFGEGEPT